MINYQRLFSSNLLNTFFLCIIFYPRFIHGEITAIIKYEYYSSILNYSNITEDTQTNGCVSSTGSQLTIPYEQAFTLMDVNGKYDGCQPSINTVKFPNRVAIIQRGGDCTFSVKITRAKQYGASAVIIYDPRSNTQGIFEMAQNNSDILSIYVSQSIGSLLFGLANDNRTYLNISLIPINMDNSNRGLWNTTRGAIIFIVISICILVCLCLSWFIFYYCQRYRLRTAKDRLQNRLTHAAKKALAKIPLITITENSHIEESCVICLDTIKIGDTIRQLMCGHTFHQHCVDPWLITHRHCPLCNLDILAAYRISIPGTNNRRRTIASETSIPIYYSSLATTAARPIIEQNNNLHHDEQQQQQPIQTISGMIKDDDSHGEQNPSYRSDDDH